VSTLTLESIPSSSDDELFKLLAQELETRIPAARGSPEFLSQIRSLPVGLRAMAATHELDVSLTMDDLGWHFGNCHDGELAEETARGLEVLGAPELARLFREAFRLALQHWGELGSEGWSEWYHGSPLEAAVEPLNEQAWKFLDKHKDGIFHYWVDYARKHPDGVGAARS
jgi:hypothetical protein